MKVSGSAVLHAPRDRVWAALIDPAVLVRTIPGCQQLEQMGADLYHATVLAGVGSIKGTYTGDVHLVEQAEPDSLVLRASGAGGPGTIQADVRVRLAVADGGDTRLDYDADAVVGGMIGGVGQRMLTGVAKKTADQFFASVDDVLTGRAAEPVAGPPPMEPLAEPGAPRVYTAPGPVRARPPVAIVMGATVLGALIALAGVLVGWLIAR